MDKIPGIVDDMRRAPQNVDFGDLCKVCDRYFGAARQQGTSHRVYQMPWAGDPRVNIQEGKSGKAKPYQIKQVLQAISKLEEMKKQEPMQPEQSKNGNKYKKQR
jgi:hypothetical protein